MTLLKWSKDRPFWESTEEIDVAVLADVLAALYRFLPNDESLPIFQQCLEPEKSEAVKICVIKACLSLILDVGTSTYEHNMVLMRTCFAGLEAAMASVTRTFEEPRAGPHTGHLFCTYRLA